MLGTYREAITQTLNDLKDGGLGQIKRKKVILANKDGLADLAGS
jgi:hypothetical protein